MFEQLYDVTEKAPVHFMGYVSERNRFDMAVVFTENFFGKHLVICMQTGKSALLSAEDMHNIDMLQRAFNVNEREDAEELSTFLAVRLPFLGVTEQY